MANPSKKATPIASEASMLDRMDQWLEKNGKRALLIALSLTTLVSLLLFDLKIDEGGDDASYLERAVNFLRSNEWPGYQGPLYPLVLALPISLFGLNLAITKILSVVFASLTVWFTYLTFRNRIPNVVTFCLMGLFTLSYSIQKYSSLTYTESFYFFLQSVALYYIVGWITDGSKPGLGNWKKWLGAGFWLFLMSITKNIGVVGVPALALFFLLCKRWKDAGLALGSFLIFRVPFEAIVRSIYGNTTTAQFKQMMQKDFYKPEEGLETFSGFVVRFITNFHHYISKRFFQILSIRPDTALMDIKALSILILIACVVVAIWAWRKNKLALFTGIWVSAYVGGTCFILQANWDQERLALIFTPYLFLFLILGFYSAAQKYFNARWIFITVISICLILNVVRLGKHLNENLPALSKNLSGDIYYGYTPDWQHFLQMSRYCADSLPENSLVASRKASMSFIYGNGKKFYGVYKVESSNPDSLLSMLKAAHVTHVMTASLRMNQKVSDGNIINTMQRLAGTIEQKYPGTFTLVKTIGETEPAELYKLNY